MKRTNYLKRIHQFSLLFVLFLSTLSIDKISAQASGLFPPLQPAAIAKQRLVAAIENYSSNATKPFPSQLERKLKFFTEVLITLDGASQNMTTELAISSNLFKIADQTSVNRSSGIAMDLNVMMNDSDVKELINIVKL